MPKSPYHTRPVVDRYRNCPQCDNPNVMRFWHKGRNGPKDYTYKCGKCGYNSEKQDA